MSLKYLFTVTCLAFPFPLKTICVLLKYQWHIMFPFPEGGNIELEMQDGGGGKDLRTKLAVLQALPVASSNFWWSSLTHFCYTWAPCDASLNSGNCSKQSFPFISSLLCSLHLTSFLQATISPSFPSRLSCRQEPILGNLIPKIEVKTWSKP